MLVTGIVLATIFTLFGIRQLVSSYCVNDPYVFLMLFFSASMIILVNSTILLILTVLGYRKTRPDDSQRNKDARQAREHCESGNQPDRLLPLRWISTLLFQFLRFLVVPVLKTSFTFSVQNAHYLPAHGPYIVTANHVSFMDPLVLQCACPHRISFLMTEKYYNPFFARWFFNLMLCIPLREESVYNIRAIRKGLRILRNGCVVGIFPEGGISPEGLLGNGRPGSMLLAQKADVPIVPAYINGTFQALPRHARFFRKAAITVIFGEPLTFAQISDGMPRKKGLHAATSILMEKIGSLSPAGIPASDYTVSHTPER